jgi:type IV pilus assembly protein PilY1
VLGVPGTAAAKKTTPKPEVMLLIDTSGSMEYRLDTTEFEGDMPICHDSRQDGFEYAKSRWAVALEVLTGTFNNYWCAYDTRLDDKKREDYAYEIPHVAARGTVVDGSEQVMDGLLDLRRDEIKFGLMAFDPRFGTSVNADGGFSYGPDKKSGGGFMANIGARNENAPWGRLVPPAKSEKVDDIRKTNDEIQEQLLAARPYLGTPIAPMLEDAAYFFANHKNVKPSKGNGNDGDPYYDCRSKSIILLTDGQPNFGEGTYGYLYSDAAAANLLAKGIKVYVIGFQLPAGTFPILDKIAKAGGTNEAFVVSSQAELVAALGAIFTAIQGTVPSRSETVITNRTLSLEDAQYQFNASYSGSTTSPLDYVGQLDQFIFRCDEACAPPDWDGGAALCEIFSISDMLNKRIEPRVIRTQIDGTMVELGVDNSDITADRLGVPTTGDLPRIDPKVLENGQVLYSGETLGDASDPDIRAEYRDQLVRLIRADAGGRREGIAFGAVQHSQPALQPNLFTISAPMASFVAYRNKPEIRMRPTVLFVGTHDGLLHAFRVDRHKSISKFEYGQELWAFMPKTLMARANDLANGAVSLLDGPIVVQDIRTYKESPVLPLDEEVERWRSILVAGYRDGGRGYFALDVTDPTVPSFLWEVSNTERCYAIPNGTKTCELTSDFQRLGKSYSEPVIASVYMEVANGYQERSVAVFGGGQAIETEVESGKSVFVVDLRTGELVREFCNSCGNVFDTNPAGKNKEFLDCPMIGAMAGYDAFIGGLLTRAFIGDSCGQLWRLDMTSPDPDNWKLEFFHDAGGGKPIDHKFRRPLVFRPALATSFTRGLLNVIYGTGDPDEPLDSNGERDRVYSLTEFWNGTSFEAKVNWELKLEAGEEFSSTPIVFEEKAYFTTQALGDGWCLTGTGRVWGLDFDGNNPGTVEDVIAAFDQDGCPITQDLTKYIELPESDVLGLKLVQRAACFAQETGWEPWESETAAGATVPDVGAGATGGKSSGAGFSGASGGGLELVMQTGQSGVSSPGMQPPEGGGAPQTGNTAAQKVVPPAQTVFSTSWGLVFD